jgi:DNA modification methylase
MIVQDKAISDIKPYQKNPRHKYDINKVAQSIKEFGFQQPIVVDRAGVIIVGHGRYEAAKSLNLKTIPVTIADLPPEKAKAYRIADNKTNEYSDWDMGLLIQEFTDLLDNNYDLELTGFDPDELEKIIVGEKEGLTDEDAVPETPEEPQAQLGDIYKLGEHRLMCGDSTDLEQTKRLLDKKIDLVFTDPPYGIDVVRSNKVVGDKPATFGKIGGGQEAVDRNQKIIASKTYSKIIGDNTTETAKKFYEICNSLELKNIILWGGNYFTDFLYPSRCWIIWDKEMTGNFSEAEMGWTSFSKGGVKVFRHLWNGLSRKGNRKDELKSRVHPTQKPVALFTDIFKKFTDFKIIYDGFLGSGSTLIACQKIDRICYGMELDPHYVDVIIKRWEDFTGQKAEKIN